IGVCSAGFNIWGIPYTNVGPWGVTVNGRALLDPPPVPTATSCSPSAASAAIVKLAVSEVALATRTSVIVMPAPAETLVPPGSESKLAPVNVTVALEPRTALAGVIAVSAGSGSGAARMVNVTAEVVPPPVVTVTSRAPKDAPGAIA